MNPAREAFLQRVRQAVAEGNRAGGEVLATHRRDHINAQLGRKQFERLVDLSSLKRDPSSQGLPIDEVIGEVSPRNGILEFLKKLL